MMITVRVSGHAELRRLAARLRKAADGGLQRDAAGALARAAPPVVARTKAAALAASFPGAPSRGGATPAGLRTRLAAATKSEPLHNGVRIMVDGAVVGPGGHRLAKLTDTELAPRWRHPVFGNRERWVTQRGQPWFFRTIRPAEPKFAAGVRQAMERTARRIEG